MTDTQTPPYHDDLALTLARALDLLEQGVRDRRSGMHTITLATLGQDGAPRLRTVVNRGFDPQERILRFHTDARSPKLDELEADPRAGVHVYDPRTKVQLRMDARATIHRAGELRAKAWEQTRDFSRTCYRVAFAPGAEVPDPLDVTFASGDDREEGSEHFAVVALQLQTLEWLYLAHQGHRRARFVWDRDGALQQTWLVP